MVRPRCNLVSRDHKRLKMAASLQRCSHFLAGRESPPPRENKGRTTEDCVVLKNVTWIRDNY
jgi:hypothetical protein